MQICLPLADDLRAPGRGRDIEEEKLAPALGVNSFDGGLVAFDEMRNEGGHILFGVAATNAASYTLARARDECA